MTEPGPLPTTTGSEKPSKTILQRALEAGPYSSMDEENAALEAALKDGVPPDEKIMSLYRSAMMTLPEDKWTDADITNRIIHLFRMSKQEDQK